MNLFDSSDPKPAPGKDPPPPGEISTPASARLPREVLQDFPGPDAGVRPPLFKRIVLWFIPNLTAFIASFCIMVLEIVAGRVIARYLGQSLYTWTSVIGIVLMGITLGNFLGGRLADWFRPAAVLAVLFLL